MLQRSIALILLVLLCACAAPKADQSLLDSTLLSYAGVIRWGNFEDAEAYIEPELRKAHPVSKIDLERYTQIKVSGYNEQPARPAGVGEVHQTVQIDIVNVNTQSMRSIVDHQVWHYDAKTKHWWLMSGLPDITQH